jgi:transcriptional regulator with XRE-family HTH domain
MRSNKKNEINADIFKQEINIETISCKLNELLVENRINNLKRGEGNPTIGTLNAICSFFGIPLIEFLGLDTSVSIQKQTIAVPLFDLRYVNQRNEQNILSKILIEKPKDTDPDTIFGVILPNNSLAPLYEKGTIFILTSALSVLDGEIVLARVQNNINSIQRLFVKKNKFFLKNLNIDDLIEGYSKNEIEVLGVVIQIIQKII